MRKIALGAMLLAPLAVTACSSSGTSNSVTAPSSAPATTATPSSAPPSSSAPAPAAPTSSSPAAQSNPLLAAGQSVTVMVDQSTYGAPKTQLTVTLLGSKTATSVNSSYGTVEQAHSGMKFVCQNYRFRNTGTGTPDLHQVVGVWVGANGQTQDPQTTTVDCSDMGVGKQGQDIVLQPNPAPGQYVEGWVASEVPAGPGVLQWSQNLDNTQLLRTPG